MRISPCKGCEKRNAFCHPTCKEYLDWKQDLNDYLCLCRSAKADI